MYSKIYRQINTITCMLLIVAFFFMAGSSKDIGERIL